MDKPTPIEIKQGATFRLPCEYTDGTNPIDLTGYTGRGSIRANASDVTAIAEFDVDITDPTLGLVEVSLPATVSAAIVLPGAGYDKPSVFYYDVELFTAADADVIWLIFGKATIYPGQTK